MKPTIGKLKVVLVYAIKYEKQENFLTGKSSNIAIPSGQIHIFQMLTTTDGIEADRFSFCKKTRSEIGEITKDSDKRPSGLPVCPQCEQNWKDHPNSPWKLWQP